MDQPAGTAVGVQLDRADAVIGHRRFGKNDRARSVTEQDARVAVRNVNRTRQHIGADVLSRTIDITDRNTCILFGDGAGAIILSESAVPNHGIRSIKLYSDGGSGRLIHL